MSWNVLDIWAKKLNRLLAKVSKRKLSRNELTFVRKMLVHYDFCKKSIERQFYLLIFKISPTEITSLRLLFAALRSSTEMP